MVHDVIFISFGEQMLPIFDILYVMLCRMSPSDIAVKMCQQVMSCSFEFVSDKPETQEPCSESVALIIGYCRFRGSVFLNKRLMIYRKAKLNICLYFACMSSRIEESKFHRSLCKSSMKVQTMISTSVIVSGSVFITFVPDICERASCFGADIIYTLYQAVFKLFTVSIFPVAVNL